jgi:hypothetical protein
VYVCHNCGEGHANPRGPSCEVCGGTLVFDASLMIGLTLPRDPDFDTGDLPELERFIIDAPDVPVTGEKGRVTVSSHELIRAGFTRRLAEFDLVRIAGGVLEILGYSYTGRIYLARLFETKSPGTIPRGWMPKPKRKRKKKEDT